MQLYFKNYSDARKQMHYNIGVWDFTIYKKLIQAFIESIEVNEKKESLYRDLVNETWQIYNREPGLKIYIENELLPSDNVLLDEGGGGINKLWKDLDIEIKMVYGENFLPELIWNNIPVNYPCFFMSSTKGIQK